MDGEEKAMQINGLKVELRHADEKWLKDLYYWKYEEEQQEADKWNGPYIPKEHLGWHDFCQQQQNQFLFYDVYNQLIITVKDRFIGTVGCYWVDQNTDWLETGIVIYDPAYWNGGYGTEAYKLWIDYLFENTNLHRLGMSTWSGNQRMMKVAERAGMKEEARIRLARQVDGEYYDAIKMGILRSEWEKNKSR